ncbi:hypothetical protein Ana3638_06085 [Anaerocolumna sedimenticola]|uniref:DUF5610 domain-containing protein n=1 Tax=Anaerocolumna sedimenticola TaxID=2696063 RepID=A0A6P1TL81_9FIRM|nr:hypothetical protein [Anaerocolumna sedimenticola]QHQ60395.1 hypothetical protein Ana3638_06085 [Anaerocolumna sedimenticola]
MGLNGITSAASVYGSTKTNQTKSKDTTGKAVTDSNQETPSAVYEKSADEGTKKVVYKQDTATISQLKADAEKRTRQLRNLVEKMLLKQGQTFDESTMYQLLREGKVPVDEETAAQAKADIAEDGYWGVNQTSDRLVSFAKALTGGDPDKIDEMIDAVKKGFEQATKTWGGELPDICKQTLDTTMKKLDEWKKSAAGQDSAAEK